MIRQDEPTQEVAEKFFRQINNPVLTNIQVNWQGNGQPVEIYPKAAPDLFANQPLVIFGRKSDRTNGKLQITGVAANGKRYEQTIPVNFDNSGTSAIAQLWGRAKIKDLMNQMFSGETTSGVEAVTNTALAYRLLSAYTAFVAVSEEVRVDPDGTRRRVQVPVELPEGVSYEGIFGSAADQVAPSASGNIQLAAPRRTEGAATRGALPPPSAIAESDTIAQANSRIEILSANGLDQTTINSLTQHLQSLNLPAGASGEITFELLISNNRIRRIALDEDASTLTETALLDAIRRQLQTWQIPAGINAKIRLQLRVLP